MRVTIRQKHIRITPALTRYIETKILKPLRRRLKAGISGEPLMLDLEFGRATRHHRKGKVYHAEANLTLGKKMLHAEADEEDIRAACDVLEQELNRELSTHKEKHLAVEKREGRQAKREFRYDRGARLRNARRVREEGN